MLFLYLIKTFWTLKKGNCVTESVKESNQVPSSQKPDLESETPKLENE